MIYYERQDYIEAKKQLKEEYAVAFEKAATYIHAAGYGLIHEENCMMQILDDFLSAQNDKKPLLKITGPDLRKFCDHIIKAEIDQMTNRTTYIIMQIAGILFCFPLLILGGIFIFQDNTLDYENLNNLHFGAFELFFIIFCLSGWFLRKAVSVIFFNHAKASKLIVSIFFIIFIGGAGAIAHFLEDNIFISVPIPLPIVLLMTVLSIAVFIVCMIIGRKNKIVRIVSQDTNAEEIDEIDKVVCPECKKEYDCDYPRCPYCKHKNMID